MTCRCAPGEFTVAENGSCDDTSLAQNYGHSSSPRFAHTLMATWILAGYILAVVRDRDHPSI